MSKLWTEVAWSKEEIENLCDFDVTTMTEDELSERYDQLDCLLTDIVNDSENDDISNEQLDFLDEMYLLVDEAMNKIYP